MSIEKGETKLLDHQQLSPAQKIECQFFAKMLSKIGPEINQVLERHGLDGMHIESFSFKTRPKGASSIPLYPTGLGVSADGVFVAK